MKFIDGKEFKRGPINLRKSIKYNEIFNKLLEKENKGEMYSEEDILQVAEFIVEVYDNQFTLDELLDGVEESELNIAFLECKSEQAEKSNAEIEKMNKSFTKGKK